MNTLRRRALCMALSLSTLAGILSLSDYTFTIDGRQYTVLNDREVYDNTRINPAAYVVEIDGITFYIEDIT